MDRGDARYDLCIVGKSILPTGESHIGVQVVSNARWWKDSDYDDSRLSWLIGKWSEEVVIDHAGQGKLEWLFRDMQGPYQVIPCLIFYEAPGDTVKIVGIHPLENRHIQRGIQAILVSIE